MTARLKKLTTLLLLLSPLLHRASQILREGYEQEAATMEVPCTALHLLDRMIQRSPCP